MQKNSNTYLVKILLLLFGNRILFFVFTVFHYLSGSFSASDLVSIVSLYIPPTVLLLTFFVLMNEEVVVSKKNTADYLAFLLLLICNMLFILQKAKGGISFSTTIILLASIECVLDVYVCKRLFLDRKQ